MSIYCSVCCPDCDEESLTLATAFPWGKIRLTCDCGYWQEIEITKSQEKALQQIIKQIPE